MKKIFIIMLLGMFLISFGSAFEFDNVKDYDPVTREVTITNAFGLGDTIGKARLNTPLNVFVAQGYQQVAEFDIWAYQDYNNALKQFTFTDMKGKTKINRDYDLKMKVIVTEEINDYDYDCEMDYSYSIEGVETCESTKTGSHFEDKVMWKKITPANLKKNERITVGVFTEVQKGDYVDWIPTIYGVEVEEWATWTASLNVDLNFYANMNDATIIDNTGTYTITNNGADSGATGILGDAFNFVSANTDEAVNKSSIGITSYPLSVSVWFDSNAGTQVYPWCISSLGTDGTDYCLKMVDNNIGTFWRNAGSSQEVMGSTVADGSYHNVVLVVKSATQREVYLDGSTDSTANTSVLWNNIGDLEMVIGAAIFGGSAYGGHYNGLIDELGVWSRALSPSEVTDLYNGGTAITYTDDFNIAPNITLNSPTVDANYTTIQNIDFNFTASDDLNLSSVKLYVNGILNQTNASGINNSIYLFPLTLSDGDYTINGIATDNQSKTANSSSVRIIIDTTPFIEFLTPPTLVNNSNITQEYIPMKINTTTTILQNITYSLRNVNGTNYTQFYENETYDINFTNIPDAHYHYDVTLCTTTNKCNNTETRHINHDATAPQINISNPKNINYFKIGNNETLNVTFTDINLESCWYDYNGTIVDIPGCLNVTLNSTNFLYELGNNNITVYANDTFGNSNFTTTTWEYKVLEINQTYNAETTEGSLETFLANISLGTGLTITGAVIMNYDGTDNTGQSFISGGNTILRKANLLIPNVDADTNVSFYWNITLSDSTNLQLTSRNQTIYNLDIDNCTAYTTELFNFTVVNEETQIILPNATIETAVNIYDETRGELVLNYSKLFSAINPLGICLNRNLTGETSYSMDVIVRYEDTGFANEYYNIVNQTLTNETARQDISLYDLNSSDSTEFQLTFTGADFLPIENALVHVERQYISENTFKTVELPKTDYNGQTVLHMVRNDVIYNIMITKGGEVLGNFENLIAFCDDFTIGDCNIVLNAFDSVETIFNTDEDLGIIYTSPTYNETSNIVSFNYLTSDGSAKTTTLEVTRNDIFGNRTICNDTLISSGGTLSCNTGDLDDTTLNVKIYVDGILTTSGNVQLDTTNYGVAGYLVMFIMALSFILMFSGSKTGVLISLGLTLAGSIGMGIVSGDLIGVGASGLWLLVIIFIGIYKLNKDRQT